MLASCVLTTQLNLRTVTMPLARPISRSRLHDSQLQSIAFSTEHDKILEPSDLTESPADGNRWYASRATSSPVATLTTTICSTVHFQNQVRIPVDLCSNKITYQAVLQCNVQLMFTSGREANMCPLRATVSDVLKAVIDEPKYNDMASLIDSR